MNANFVFHSSLGKAERMFLFCWDFSAVKLLGNVLAVIVLGKHERDYKLLREKGRRLNDKRTDFAAEIYACGGAMPRSWREV